MATFIATTSNTKQAGTATGTNSDDTMIGQDGGDTFYGLGGADSLYGGGGKDYLYGGDDCDTLNGGAGSDMLDGGAASDLLVYALADNVAVNDTYSGGSGLDRLQLQLGAAEWASFSLQSEVVRYALHLATLARTSSGEILAGTGFDFLFDFGNSTKLLVSMVESFEVTVDGVVLDLSRPTLTCSIDGALAEDGAGLAGGRLQSQGFVSWIDTDVSDTHSVSVDAAATNRLAGVLKAAVVDAATGDGIGQVDWSYSVDNAATQFLAQGQRVTERFNVTIADSSGKSATQAVEVSVTGTNDAPVITSPALATSVVEAGSPTGLRSTSGNLGFSDADLSDVHRITAVAAGAGVLGTLSASLKADTTGNGTGGLLSWSYNVDGAALEYLAAGQVRTEDFTITLADDQGGDTRRTVQVALTGTNDAPVITAQTLTGNVTEAGLPGGLRTSSGTIAFSDVDLADVHHVTTAAAGTGVLGTLTASINTDTTGGGAGGLLTWTYSVDHSALLYLAEGQTKVEDFTVSLSDGQGSSAQRTVQVTITGSSEAPVITDGTFNGSFAEMGSARGTLYTGGTISFTDMDPAAVHRVSATAVNGGALGTFLANVTTDTTGGDSHGLLSWSYSTWAAALEYLSEGQTRTEDFVVTLSSDQGGSVQRTVSITFTGANDLPVGEDDKLVSIAEDAAATSMNIAAPTDVDLSDSLSATVTALPASSVGTVKLGSGAAVSNGQVLTIAELQGLKFAPNANGGGLSDYFRYTVNDNHGGSDAAQVALQVQEGNTAATNTLTFAGGDLIYGGNMAIPTGYGGFDWSASNPGVSGTTPDFFYGTKYDIIGNAAWTYGAGTVSTMTWMGSGTINVQGAYFLNYSTSKLQVSGYNNGTLVAQTTLSLSKTASYQTLGFNNVNKLVFNSSVSGSGSHYWSMDNFGYSFTPVVKLQLDGTTGNDVLVGSSSADRLQGYGGNDLLVGGGGSDTFVFNTIPDISRNIDTVSDFTPGTDRIEIDGGADGVFPNLPVGPLSSVALDIVGDSTPARPETRFIYDPSTGALYFDQDGTAATGAAPGQFALLANKPALTYNDFLIA